MRQNLAYMSLCALDVCELANVYSICCLVSSAHLIMVTIALALNSHHCRNSVVLCWRNVNSHNTLNLMDSSPNASDALSQQRKRKQAFISTICKCTLKHIFMCCLLALVVHPVFFCLLAFLFIVLTLVNCIFIQFSWVYCCSL
jgi:hypothetical protein